MTEENVSLGQQLAVVTEALTEIDRISAGLGDLRHRYHGIVYSVTTTTGMAEARAARKAIREPRMKVEHARIGAKRKILAVGKDLDTEAARITAALREIEDPIDAQITAEEERKERQRIEREQAEQRRVAKLQKRIAELRGNRTLSAFSGPALIAQHIEDIQRIPIDDSFDELRQQAEDAKGAGLAWLRELHAAAVAHEAEQMRIAAERAELERLRREQAEHEAAERKRQAEEAELGRMRMSEIHGIQQQVLIASTGRAGVRKGGTRECIIETLIETRAWAVTEEKFGPLASIAQSTQASAIAQIGQLLVQWDKSAEEKRIAAIRNRIQAIRVADGISRQPATIIQKELDDILALRINDDFAEFKDEAQAAKNETMRRLAEILNEREAYEAEQAQFAAQRAELDRIETQQRAAREEAERIEAQKKAEHEAEERRLEEQRAELARQQEELRLAQERANAPPEAPTPEPQPEPDPLPAFSAQASDEPAAPEPPEFAEEWAERACDSIDAGFFSGDTFHSPEALARIEWYMARWQRQIASIKEMLVTMEAA